MKFFSLFYIACFKFYICTLMIRKVSGSSMEDRFSLLSVINFVFCPCLFQLNALPQSISFSQLPMLFEFNFCLLLYS